MCIRPARAHATNQRARAGGLPRGRACPACDADRGAGAGRHTGRLCGSGYRGDRAQRGLRSPAARRTGSLHSTIRVANSLLPNCYVSAYLTVESIH
nr:MAG TPA: hypothetical protein [Caudoviricetes sp.]